MFSPIPGSWSTFNQANRRGPLQESEGGVLIILVKIMPNYDLIRDLKTKINNSFALHLGSVFMFDDPMVRFVF